MKYSDFISLQDYFHPVFSLQNETSGYWEKFIPTEQFNTLLETTLDAVSSNIPSNRKSIWIQGTFGTGKSHASAVVKHLLCDDTSKINDYIDRIENPNLKNRLASLREEKRYFPVVLSGIEGAYNPHTFALTLERSIKEALRNAEHKISVNSDFENAIELIESKLTSFIQPLIDDTPELRIIAKNKEEILQKLQSSDIDLYLTLEKSLQEKYSIQLSAGDLTKWLSEIEAEIRNSNIADGLLIFWDEFTSILDTIGNGIINMLQKIAELAEKQNIYLYLISHRNTKAYGEKAEEIKKMQDRFHIIKYNMKAITTYHIMAATLKKPNDIDNRLLYNKIRDAKMHKFDDLISYLTDNSSQQSKDDMKNLFPLHPYTAFLCSPLADHIGSANRSVFNFMYDSQSGFLHFLQDEEAFTENRLLTANCLWDFFLESFTDDPIKYGPVTETYNVHIDTVSVQGLAYKKVFKGILLLNAMHNTFRKEQVLPSSKNIKYLFNNEDFENELDTILKYLDENQIVPKDPSGNFIIESSISNQPEINAEIIKITPDYKDALSILDFDPNHKQNITKLLSDTLIRCSEYCFLSCSDNEYYIKSRLKKGFKQSYSLHISLFFATNEGERQSMSETVARLAQEEDFKNVVFVIFKECLNDDLMQLQRFIYYVASQRVAKRYNSEEVVQTNQKKANQIVLNWLDRLQRGNCTLYFNTGEYHLTAYTLAQHSNQNIISKIFSSGIEILESMRLCPTTFHKPQSSPKSAEIMLCAINRDDAEKKFSSGQYKYANLLFKDDADDYIVEQDLQLKKGIPNNHPLVLVQQKVDELLKKQYAGSFNLGRVLDPLTKISFGLYSNIPNVSLLAFALRKYRDKLYDAELGVPISADNLRDKIVALFDYWQNGKNEDKLNVRFGSEEETELINILIEVFDLRNVHETGELELSSIKNVRWGIAHYCKHKKYPLWSLQHTGSSFEVNKLIGMIVNMVHKENMQTQEIKELYQLIKSYKFDLQNLLSGKERFEKGFRNFVNEIKSVRIEDDWWDKLSAYLFEHMQCEIGYWKAIEVESKVKEFYIIETEKPAISEEEKRELIGNLIEIFDLQLGNEASIEDVRLGIADYCKNKSKYPLWSLKHTDVSSDEVNKLIDMVVSLVHKEDTPDEQIKELIKSIEEHKQQLQHLLSDKNNFGNGFRNFVNKIKSVSIKGDLWNELLEKYLPKELGDETGYWKEVDAESKIKDFYIKKKEDVLPPTPPPIPTEVTELIQKIIVSKNLETPALKSVLITILYEFHKTGNSYDLIKEKLKIYLNNDGSRKN